MLRPRRPQRSALLATRRLALATVATTLVTAGCSTNFGAQTQQVYDAGAGVNDRSGDVYVLNALVVSNGDSTGTLSVALLERAGDPDALLAVDATTLDGQPLSVQQHPSPLTLCPTQLTNLGPTAAVTLKGNGLVAGVVVSLGLRFQNAAPVRVDVPVIARGDSGIYDGVATAPSSSATPATCGTSGSGTPAEPTVGSPSPSG